MPKVARSSLPHWDDLASLDRKALAAAWLHAFGRPIPSKLYKNTVMLLLGYRLQELKLGGLSSGARRHLNSFLSRTNGGKAARPTRRLKPGTRLQRSWQGRTHIVTVADDGFEYAGQTYASLSVIARTITGTAWSGPAFFGLKGTATKRATA